MDGTIGLILVPLVVIVFMASLFSGQAVLVARFAGAGDAERVNRGSTTISLALLGCLASMTHLNPQGWASAALPPMISTRSAFLMSTQWLVIAPRPNVGARLATVGACQTRAWLSKTSIPIERIALWVM